MTQAQATAYVSEHCLNCTRLISIVRSSKLASREVRIVDVDTLPASARAKLTAVPTIQTPNNTTVVGSEAFNFLKKYESDVELGSWDIASGSLLFSDYITGDGIPQSMGTYDTFEPLPP